jgi:hypothetical protein
MNRIGGIKLLVVLASVCLVTVSAAEAATIEFRLLINDQDVATYTNVGQFTLKVQARVMNNLIMNDGAGSDYIGGMLNYSFGLVDSTGILPASILEPAALTGLNAGKWNNTVAPTGWTVTRGLVNKTSLAGDDIGVAYDVISHTGAISPGSWGDLGLTYGGAIVPQGTTVNGDWATIAGGLITYDGGVGTLSLRVKASSQTVMNSSFTASFPTAVTGDSINFGAVANVPPTKPVVNPTEILEVTWNSNGKSGWNHPEHSVNVTAASTDGDGPSPLTYQWMVTKPGGGSLTLGTTGPVLTLTIADIASLGLPAWVGADDPSYHWNLSVKAFDGEAYSQATDISMFVPEPATMGLLAVGVFGLIKRRRRA